MKTSAPFQHRAKDAALTPEVVRDVVVLFYERIRDDSVLGPIFEDAIGEDWGPHIERIVQFWLTATHLGGGYDGRNFMPAHVKHPSIDKSQVPRWLKIFRDTATRQCHSEGALVLVDIAERMAETLQIGLAKRNQEQTAAAPGRRIGRT
jgi:hemoglobin